jgi:hypothetical protein
MKTAILFALCAFGLTICAQAQGREHSMTGCLEKGTAPNSYMLTHVEGNGPKMVGIVASTPNLVPHVGHKIEITGTAVPASEAEADKNVTHAPYYMKVSAIKMISTNCPEIARERR